MEIAESPHNKIKQKLSMMTSWEMKGNSLLAYIGHRFARIKRSG